METLSPRSQFLVAILAVLLAACAGDGAARRSPARSHEPERQQLIAQACPEGSSCAGCVMVGDDVSCPGRDPTAAVRTVKKIVEKAVEAVEVTQGAKTAADAVQATQAAAEAREAAAKKRKECFCICGLPDAPLSDRKSLGHMLEAECRARCASKGEFPYGEYTCV